MTRCDAFCQRWPVCERVERTTGDACDGYLAAEEVTVDLAVLMGVGAIEDDLDDLDDSDRLSLDEAAGMDWQHEWLDPLG